MVPTGGSAPVRGRGTGAAVVDVIVVGAGIAVAAVVDVVVVDEVVDVLVVVDEVVDDVLVVVDVVVEDVGGPIVRVILLGSKSTTSRTEA